jgi:hypothetical protein
MTVDYLGATSLFIIWKKRGRPGIKQFAATEEWTSGQEKGTDGPSLFCLRGSQRLVPLGESSCNRLGDSSQRKKRRVQ